MNILEKLKAKYTDHKIISSPLINCPVCNSRGEFFSSLTKKETVCMCVCLSGNRKTKMIQLIQLKSVIELSKEVKRDKLDIIVTAS